VTRSYEIVSQDKKRSAKLIVGPAAYQSVLFVASVLYHDEDGEMKAPAFASAESADDAAAKARAWIGQKLFPGFSEKLHREW
jgi:hypothetical protein